MAGLLEGLPIIDAEEVMDLHVQKRDINRRAAKDPAHCALAECMMRQSGYHEVRVYLSRAYVKEDDHWVRYEVSQIARREITAFDRGAAFMPGTYRLYPTHPSNRLENKKKKVKPHEKKWSPPRAIPQMTAGIRPRSAVIPNKKV